ncbi:MAG: ShlB/FhaC/HecB family hemolysin secretion/activation protein, partial [Limnothrix sp.]
VFAQADFSNIELPQNPRDLSDNLALDLEKAPSPAQLGNSDENPNQAECFLGDESAAGDRHLVEKIIVEGNTVLHKQIEEVISPYIGEELTSEERFCIASQITALYTDEENSFITSGAFIPGPDFDQPIVYIQVSEGRLSENGIQIAELKHINESFIRSRLERAAQPPLNQHRLEEALELLQLKSEFFKTIQANLIPGINDGENILKIVATERPPFKLTLSASNSRPPNLGEWESSIQARYDNLLGIGDRLSANYGITEGLDTYSLNYQLPFNARDGSINLSYSKNDSEIISQNFRDLGIRSNSKNFSIGIQQPLSQSPTQSLAIGLDFDLRRSQSYILDDIPFSFSIGPENGASKVSALRFSQDWYQRNQYRIFAAKSQFSFGLNAFDATINERRADPDGEFFKWLGQFQYIQQLSDSNIALITQINTQLTPDSLLSLEQFSVGGFGTVRGYSQNYLTADNGINLSLELRVPVSSNFTLRPFFEAATVWSSAVSNAETQRIASIGLGMTWNPISNLSFALDYGVPLTTVSSNSN